MYKIALIILIFILTISVKTYSQNSHDNLLKYWSYRDRLKYFVSVGDQPGQSLISPGRNIWGDPVIDFGDETLNLGWYIGLLATEYKLLSNTGTDCSKTLRELYYAIEAYKRLDLNAESDFGYPNSINGFFRREDSPQNFVTLYSQELNKGLNSTDIFGTKPNGQPTWIDEVYSWNGVHTYISQDQAIHLLLGFALVKKCFLPNVATIVKDNDNHTIYYYFNNEAVTLSHKIIKYIQNWPTRPGTTFSWTIYKPNGVAIPYEWGGDAQGFAIGFAKAGDYITADPFIDPYTAVSGASWVIWQAQQYQYFESSHAHMITTLAAIGDSWRQGLVVNTTYSGILNITDNTLYSLNWDTFYTMLWKYLHNKNKNLDVNKIEYQLNSAPCDGPYTNYPSGDHAGDGWASTCRFRMNRDLQINGQLNSRPGNYNGIDYMLLYNLYHLIYNPVFYTNYIDYDLTNVVNEYMPYRHGSSNTIIGTAAKPYTLYAFNSITSKMVINLNTSPTPCNPAQPGDVTFVAGEKIILKPGFIAKYGTHFLAKIESFTMCDLLNQSKTNVNNNSLQTMFEYDSIITEPLKQDYFFPEEESEITEYLPQNSDSTMQIQQNLNEIKFAIFPNPAKNIINIKATGELTECYNISIFSLLGVSVKNFNCIEKNLFNINVSDLPSGMYSLIITYNGKLQKEELIIQ